MLSDGSRVLRSQLSLPRPYIAPCDAVESALADIWREVLNLDAVGVEDEFGDLGGDSFDATVVSALIDDGIGVHVPLSKLVDTPTIAKLAKEILRIKAGRGDQAPPLEDGKS